VGSKFFDHLGRRLVDLLEQPIKGYMPATPPDPEALRRTLRPGDVLLFEGNSRVASVIKYLTQSTWSHAALYLGPIAGRSAQDGEPHVLVEALASEGVVSAPLSKYLDSHIRICRPLALTPEDMDALRQFALAHIGNEYDLKNIFDLIRYLVPLPVPSRFRRRMLALGSGSPTRAICSSLIAEAFQSVRYPILPRVKTADDDRRVKSQFARDEIMHIRHHSLYTPRDFDLSPYFAIVKPTIEKGFDYKIFQWGETGRFREPVMLPAVE